MPVRPFHIIMLTFLRNRLVWLFVPSHSSSTPMRLLCLIAVATTIASCQPATHHHASYPEPFPDTVALSFLPGIVSADSLDFNAAFSPDGRTFYFCRSVNRKWSIWQTTFDGNNWSAPALAPFADTAWSQADPFITPDSTVYFISNQPTEENAPPGDFDIWYAHQATDGSWEAPVNLTAVNSDSTEYYVSLARNGNLYFASNRGGGYDIYSSARINGHYARPVLLSAAINSPVMEHDPCISPDEQLLLFTSVNRDGGMGEGDVYVSRKDAQGNWGTAKNLGPAVNTTSYEYCAAFSPDGKYLFFSSDNDVKWISMKKAGLPE